MDKDTNQFAIHEDSNKKPSLDGSVKGLSIKPIPTNYIHHQAELMNESH